jgi:hypothetical protein
MATQDYLDELDVAVQAAQSVLPGTGVVGAGDGYIVLSAMKSGEDSVDQAEFSGSTRVQLQLD